MHICIHTHSARPNISQYLSVHCAAPLSLLLILLIPFLLFLKSWLGFIFYRNHCVPEWSRDQQQGRYNQKQRRLFKLRIKMQSWKLTVVAEVWMPLCTISIPHIRASTSRVLATSTINKRHWGRLFTAHKKTMGRIKKDNQYLNHMKVVGPWENKNWILLVILIFCYWLVWKNASVFYASKRRTCKKKFTYRRHWLSIRQQLPFKSATRAEV